MIVDEQMMDKFEVTEEILNKALNLASWFSKSRLIRKMEKTVYGRPGSPRPPKDLEQWVSNWCQIQLAKHNKFIKLLRK